MTDDRRDPDVRNDSPEDPTEPNDSPPDEVALRKENTASVSFEYAALAVGAAVVFLVVIVFAFGLLGGGDQPDTGPAADGTNATVGSDAEQNAVDTQSGD